MQILYRQLQVSKTQKETAKWLWTVYLAFQSCKQYKNKKLYFISSQQQRMVPASRIYL